MQGYSIAEMFGPGSLPTEPNVFRSRSKNAQEAHEAIRPTAVRRLPDAVKARLGRDQARLYELIWRRFMASQMAPAVFDTIQVEVSAGTGRSLPMPFLFRARGSWYGSRGSWRSMLGAPVGLRGLLGMGLTQRPTRTERRWKPDHGERPGESWLSRSRCPTWRRVSGWICCASCRPSISPNPRPGSPRLRW